MALEIYAGPQALTTLHEHGFNPDLFSTLLGASGGPKWFVLYGLDKFLFGELFKGRTQPLNIIGSSVGSFRAACFAQNDPVAATERMAHSYIGTTYDTKYVSPQTLTDSMQIMLQYMLGENGMREILSNPVIKPHFITAKTNGLSASENRLLQSIGLLNSARNNRKDRALLARQYERFIFQAADSSLIVSDPDGFHTQHIALTPANLFDAILASGSLPVMMQGIHNIGGAPAGIYRDGGIIDYHYDFNVDNTGLILYPHFSAKLRAGWFDKKLPRRVRSKHYARTVLICPSAEFIAALPHQKIPDRADFTKLSNEERMSYWRTVTRESERLAEELAELCQTQDLSRIKAIDELTSTSG